MSDIWKEGIGAEFQMENGTFRSNATKAAGLAVMGMCLLGFIDNFVRVVAEDIGVWQFHLSRTCFVLGLMLPFALWRGWRLRPKRLGAVAIRSFCVSTAMILYFGAVAALPIAEVGAGLFTSPIFVLVISLLVFRVRIGPARIFAVLLGFTGVLLMLRPDAGGFTLFSLIPVAAGLFYAFGAVATRQLCEGESTMTLLTGFFAGLGLWGLVGVTYFAVTGQMTDPAVDGFFGTGWQPFTAQALQWIVLQGLFSLAGVGLITRAYQLADASHVAVFEYAFLISAGFWSHMLWNEVPDTLGLLGIVLIILAGVMIILRNKPAAAKVAV